MNNNDFSTFVAGFMNESDRAAVVLGAAHIDELLKEILQARLIDVKSDCFEPNGILGTFSSKIEMACAIGAIDKNFANKIDLIRRIRNDCAHKITTINFEEPPVSQRILELQKVFSASGSWPHLLTEAKSIFQISGNSLVLRVAIASVVAALAVLSPNIKRISGEGAGKLVFPQHVKKSSE